MASNEKQILLATLPPSHGQIRLALGVVLILLVAFAVTVPFAKIQLPSFPVLIPVLQTVILINDLTTSALLFAQFSVVHQRALLVLAGGYLFTGLIVIPHALTFPGAFTPVGLLGATLNSTVWLYIFWHLGSPLSVIVYTLLKDVDREPRVLQRSPITVGAWSLAVVIATVCGLTWLVTAKEWILPRIFIDDVRVDQILSPLFAGLIISFNAVAIALLWIRRRSVLDLWLLVVCCAGLIEATIAAALIESRFSLGWYAGRIYALVGTLFVLFVLLSETTILYANLARSAMRWRSNREGRHVAMDAMAASIAHEVNQPITAMTFNSDAGLEFLAESPPNIDKARAAFEAIANDGIRAGAIVAGLRAMFKSGTHQRVQLDVNDLLQEVLNLVEVDLRTHRISVSTELREGLPQVYGDRVQLQQVFLNLIMNAIDAMHSVTNRVRTLRIRSEFIQEPSGVLVTIEDSGAGIDSKDKDRIFEPFFTTKSTGTGIGLAICRSIVESHNGHIRSSANHPYGTIFGVALPMADFESPTELQ